MVRCEDIRESQIHCPTDMMVRIKAAALNRADFGIHQGVRGAKIVLPHILGSDGAGAILA
jgi:NADPH:quinone reductase-like Zn-dependent oxidoreductase